MAVVEYIKKDSVCYSVLLFENNNLEELFLFIGVTIVIVPSRSNGIDSNGNLIDNTKDLDYYEDTVDTIHYTKVEWDDYSLGVYQNGFSFLGKIVSVGDYIYRNGDDYGILSENELNDNYELKSV